MGVFGRKDVDPGLEPAQAQPYSAMRPLTAAAQRITLTDKTEVDAIKKRRAADAWQTDAWEYFDAIGEIKYSANLVGAILSRVRLFPAHIVHFDEPPVHVRDIEDLDKDHSTKAEKALRRLDSANGGLSGLLSRGGVNVWVAGECNLVQIPPRPEKQLGESWDMKSVDELVVGNDGLAIKTSRHGSEKEDLAKNSFVGRIWRSHPRYSGEADSSLRAVRDPCDELLLYSRLSRTIGRSRMNAGALLLPDGLAVSGSEVQDTDLTPTDIDGEVVLTDDVTDDFEQELMQALTDPIADEQAASAVVPLLIRGPKELLEGVKHITFDREMDQQLLVRADRALERVLQGLDMPKDVVTGLANVKYSNAVQIDESLYKAHIEPLILLLCDALTEVYFRPALIAAGVPRESAMRFVIWYDPTEILTRPDRAESANTGLENGSLSHDAWRRAHGYSEADAPSPQEQVIRMVLERGPVGEQLVETMLKLVAPEIFAQVRADSLASSESPLSENARNILEQSGPPPVSEAEEKASAPDQEPASPPPASTESAPATKSPPTPPVPLAEPAGV